MAQQAITHTHTHTISLCHCLLFLPFSSFSGFSDFSGFSSFSGFSDFSGFSSFSLWLPHLPSPFPFSLSRTHTHSPAPRCLPPPPSSVMEEERPAKEEEVARIRSRTTEPFVRPLDMISSMTAPLCWQPSCNASATSSIAATPFALSCCWLVSGFEAKGVCCVFFFLLLLFVCLFVCVCGSRHMRSYIFVCPLQFCYSLCCVSSKCQFFVFDLLDPPFFFSVLSSVAFFFFCMQACWDPNQPTHQLLAVFHPNHTTWPNRPVCARVCGLFALACA